MGQGCFQFECNIDVQARMTTAKSVPDPSPETRNLAANSSERSSLKCTEVLKYTEHGESMGWALQRRTMELSAEADKGLLIPSLEWCTHETE